MTDDDKRMRNYLEIKMLRAQNAVLITQFMGAVCQEHAADINKQIKLNAARTAELEKEQFALACKQLRQIFKRNEG